jgi:DNA-binding GntR family transcriptional regulator
VSTVDQLRQDIVNGFYNPRERLVEVDLVERYGATRSAVRAALLELTSEGLVERELNRGARIRALTVKEAIEIAEARRELEALCARLAAERATDEERTALGRLVTVMQKAVADGDIATYMSSNATFHTSILAMSRHNVAAKILTQLGNLNFNRHFPMAFASRHPTVSMHEHERIADAIIRSDTAEAEAAMHDHLTSLITVLLAQDDGAAERPAGA